jgi:pimeloyl-[acyl-carrier protein] methyl ester esterase
MTTLPCYFIEGNGKPILLIHGWAMDSSVWKFFREDFSADYTVIAVDLRGHGKSASLPGPYNLGRFAADIEALVTDLNVHNATAIGWSMGVSVLLKMCAQSSARIDSLVFISGTPSLIARDNYPHGVPRATAYSLLRQLKRDFAAGMSNFYAQIFSDEGFNAGENEPIYSLVADIRRAPQPHIACEALESLQREDLRPLLNQITLPSLFIHGACDRICLPAASAYMAHAVRDAQLAIIDGAGHAPFLTAADRVHRTVRTFIRQIQ